MLILQLGWLEFRIYRKENDSGTCSDKVQGMVADGIHFARNLGFPMDYNYLVWTSKLKE